MAGRVSSGLWEGSVVRKPAFDGVAELEWAQQQRTAVTERCRAIQEHLATTARSLETTRQENARIATGLPWALQSFQSTANAQLARLERRLAEAEVESARKDEILALLGHELRNPLTAINMGSAALERLDLPPAATRVVGTIRESVALQAHMIESLLHWSRVQREGWSARERLDVHEVVRVTVESCVRPATVGLSTLFDAAHVDVLADPVGLHQVFWNLLGNAVAAVGGDGNIVVRSTNKRPDCVTLDVRDTGVGLTGDEIIRVFEPFRQGARARGLLGLGLAICKKVVEDHGGRISASSRGPGRGATFRVELPCAA